MAARFPGLEDSNYLAQGSDQNHKTPHTCLYQPHDGYCLRYATNKASCGAPSPHNTTPEPCITPIVHLATFWPAAAVLIAAVPLAVSLTCMRFTKVCSEGLQAPISSPGKSFHTHWVPIFGHGSKCRNPMVVLDMLTAQAGSPAQASRSLSSHGLCPPQHTLARQLTDCASVGMRSASQDYHHMRTPLIILP
jgi:hypothetical protein